MWWRRRRWSIALHKDPTDSWKLVCTTIATVRCTEVSGAEANVRGRGPAESIDELEFISRCTNAYPCVQGAVWPSHIEANLAFRELSTRRLIRFSKACGIHDEIPCV